MREAEINPRDVFTELRAMQAKERDRLINESMEGRALTAVQRKRLNIELEFSSIFEGGKLIATDEDGTPLRDPHGWPVPVKAFIQQTAASLFTESTEAPQENTPISSDELFNLMRGAKSDTERVKIYKAYKGS